jgi:hypothetical protein
VQRKLSKGSSKGSIKDTILKSDKGKSESINHEDNRGKGDQNSGQSKKEEANKSASIDSSKNDILK